MTIPPSNHKVLSKLLKDIEAIDAQFSAVQETLGNAETQLHISECNYKAVAAIYEQLRLRRNQLLNELRGQSTEAQDFLSSTVYSNVSHTFSSRKLEELKNAGIAFMGDLAQAKMVKDRGRPLSLHPRLADGTWREAGVPVVGKKSIAYLEILLAKHGLMFGMSLPDWIRPINLEELPGEIRTQDELLNTEAETLLKKIPGGAPWVTTRHHWGDNGPAMLIGELVQMSEREVLKMEYIGPKELSYIKQTLRESGLSLGMSLPNWVRPDK